MTTAPERGEPQTGKSFEQVKDQSEKNIRCDTFVLGGVTYRVTVHGKEDCTADVQEKLLGLLKIHSSILAIETETC
ncbi:MAG: hypothetical protein MJ192_03520, partial [Clostridia bacterium]|nr:hypothetical protein [Clostridia bacterium]